MAKAKKSGGASPPLGSAVSSPSQKSELDYRAEDDHRTLQRAAEIGGDPSRMQGVARHHKKLTRGMSKVGQMIGRR